MPQVIAVWAEQLGHEIHYHSYTGFEDLTRLLPDNLDLLFFNCFTQSAYTAYCLSHQFRQKGIVTVLGGPHARSYAEDARHHFDYVLGMTDKNLIETLLKDPAPQPEMGVFLATTRQPLSLPTVRERWKFIQKNLEKTRILQVVPLLGSLGCPYTCDFCIDAKVDYQQLPFDQLRDDLIFLQSQPKPPIVAWYDPNFGVRFDEYLDLIESAVPPGRMSFGGESSLSLLSEPHLKRLQKNNFIVMLPGIETWFDFNAKSKQGKNQGLEKVKSTSEQINLVLQYIPYVQTNHIFGTDVDAGPEPFELTKKFIELTPGVFTNFMLITAYGNSAPLSVKYQAEKRVLDVPFPFLDGSAGLNVRLKNYGITEFYDALADLVRFTFSAKTTWRRFRANHHPLPRWMNLMRVAFSGKGRGGNHLEIRNQYLADPEFQSFYNGETMKPPAFYQRQIQSMLGSFYDQLPPRVLNYLQQGESYPNPRIAPLAPAVNAA